MRLDQVYRAGLAATLLGVVACSGAPTEPADTDMTVRQVVASLDSLLVPALGFTRTVTATALDETGREIPGVGLRWGTREPAIAGVDGGGRVEGRGYGSTAIIVSAQGAADTVTVVVKQVPASITLTSSNDTLTSLGSLARVAVLAIDSAGSVIEGPEGRWSSSDSAVAIPNQFGAVRAVGSGVATIMWRYLGQSAATTVVVSQTPDFLWIHRGEDELTVGDTTTVLASMRDSRNESIDDVVVEWSTSDEAVATVSDEGLVTAVGGGNVVITGSSEGLSGWRALSVLPDTPPSGALSVSPGPLLADAWGQEFVLRADVDDGSGSVVPVPAVWTSRSTSHVRVDGSVATALANGSTWLVAEYDGRADSVRLVVDRVPVALDFQDVPEHVVITLSDGAPVYPGTVDRLGGFENVAVTWTSRDPGVAEVDGSGIGGRRKGETWVIAEAMGFVDSIHVEVLPIYGSDIEINTLQDLDWFESLAIEEMGGSLWVYQTPLSSVHGLESLRSVAGDVWVKLNGNLTDIGGLANLESIGGRLTIEKNPLLADPSLPNLGSVGELEVYDNAGVSAPSIFPSLKRVVGTLYLAESGPSVTMSALQTVGSLHVYFEGPTELSLPNLEWVADDLYVVDVPEMRLLSAPKLWRLGGLTVRGNESLESIDLSGLTTIQGAVTIEANAKLMALDRIGPTSGARAIRIDGNPALASVEGLRTLGDALGSDPIVTQTLWIKNNPILPTASLLDLVSYIEDKYPGASVVGAVSIGGNG